MGRLPINYCIFCEVAINVVPHVVKGAPQEEYVCKNCKAKINALIYPSPENKFENWRATI